MKSICPPFSRTEWTVMFLSLHKSNRTGKVTQRASLSSHFSSQKEQVLPFLTLISLPLKYMCLTLIKSCQTGESSSLCFTVLMLWFLRYFAFIISCHRPFSVSNFHYHLQSKLRFIFLRSFTPIPPFFLFLQITSHLTRWYFLLVPPPCQKKVLLCLSNCWVMV